MFINVLEQNKLHEKQIQQHSSQTSETKESGGKSDGRKGEDYHLQKERSKSLVKKLKTANALTRNQLHTCAPRSPDEIVFHSVHHAPVECPCGVTAFHLACQHLVKEPKQKWCFGHQQAQELHVKLCYWISRTSCAPAQTATVVDVPQRSRERTNWRTKREGGGRKKKDRQQVLEWDAAGQEMK